MNFKAPTYISDTNFGYRVKSLFILLAKTTAEMNNAPSKISDLRSIIYHLEKTKENIFDVQNSESERLSERISHSLDANIRSVEDQIHEIDSGFAKTKQEKDFILLQLNEHGVPWHDRSLMVGNFRKTSAFINDDSQVDNAMLATEVYRDLCRHLPAEVFKIKLVSETTPFKGSDEPAISAIITFSSVYSDLIKDALKKIVEEKLSSLSRGFGICDEKDLDGMSSHFLYDFYAYSASGYLRALINELIQSTSPDKELSSIQFHKELVFLNLDEYHDTSDLLSEYVSMISKERTVVDPLLSQKAEANCMEAYYEDHKGEVNIGRLVQALEREMEASQSLKQISQ